MWFKNTNDEKKIFFSIKIIRLLLKHLISYPELDDIFEVQK